MAHPTAADRERHGFRDGKFPVYDRHTALAAIKLRSHSDDHSAAAVLAHVLKWAKGAGDQTVLRAIAEARKNDKG